MTDRSETARQGERGSALILAIFAMVLLTAVGVALMFRVQTGLKLNRADHRAKRSFYLAEAGVEHARAALFAANGAGSFSDDLVRVSGTNPTIDFNADNLVAVFDGTGALTGFSAGVGDDVPLVGITAFGDGSYTAFLTNDPIESTSSTTDVNERVMLTGIGAGPDRSLEVVQAIVEPFPLLISPPPAAVTLLGPTPDWYPGRSNAKLYEGNDCSGGGLPGLFLPTVGAIGATAAQIVRDDMDKPTYAAGPLAPELTIADLTDTTEPTVTTAIDPLWTDCLAVRDMIEGIRQVADVICTSDTCALPAPSPGRVVFADCDFDPGSGVGLLVVTGQLTFRGNADWKGIILAIGEGRVLRNGGGNGTLSGAIVVADIAGPDETYGTDDDCTGGDRGFGIADWRTNGAGNSTVVYCSTDIGNTRNHRVYRIVEFLQK